jgi:hypothetical protein
MTAKACSALLVLIVALVWTSAMAADYGNTAGISSGKTTAGVDDSGNATISYSDGDWSGRWINGQWTPGYWYGGMWNQAELENGQWTVSVEGDGQPSMYTISSDEWDAMGTPEASRTTGELDSARDADYDNGRVMGYSDSRDEQMNVDADKDEYTDRDNDDDDYNEGAKCGGRDSGCGCHSKCGGCGHRSCGCGSKCGGNKCGGNCGHKSCGCQSHGCGGCHPHWDCWNVSWEEHRYSADATRDSDYDPVMGRGEYGHGFFGW